MIESVAKNPVSSEKNSPLDLGGSDLKRLSRLTVRLFAKMASKPT